MQRKSVSLLLFFLVVFTSFSQEKTVEEVLESTISSQLLENVHLHFNKTSFIRGEHLWFTAYIQDQISQLPSLTTNSLHVGIFDESGQEVKRKLLRVENGIATGDFEIDSSFVKDSYLVLGWTNYMKNFQKLPPFQEKIEIIDEISSDKNGDDSSVLEIFSEGGGLISDAYNMIGVRYNSPNGSNLNEVKLRLLDEKGKVINSNITLNSDGHGKLGFTVNSKKDYTLEATLSNGELLKVPLLQPTEGSIGLIIDNTGEDILIAKLVVSEEVLSEKSDLPYTIAVVQDNNIFIEDWVIDKDELALSIARESLPYGINTAILFDEQLRPIARRMFFNHIKRNERMIDVSVSHQLNNAKDSLELHFELPEQVEGEVSMSISILPDETIAYNPNNSLTSSFLINPYVKSSVLLRNDLKDFNRYKRYALDTKLLIEGWGRYDWDDRISKVSKIDFKEEMGIELSGKILDADLQEEKQVYFMTDESKAMQFEDLKNDKSFSTSMILYENDSLGVSLIGEKGILRKPNLEIQFNSSKGKNQYDFIPIFDKNNYSFRRDSDNFDEENIPLTFNENTILLDEVVVTERTVLDNKLDLVSSQLEGRFITDVEIERYSSVAGYLRKMGYRVEFRDGRMLVFSKRLEKGVRPLMFLMVDGMPAQRGELINMPLSRVQSIVGGSGVMGSGAGSSNFISITTRQDHYVAPENRNKFIKKLIVNGYARPQQYFNPGYADYGSSTFRKYGAIDWKPIVSLNKEESTTIKLPNYGLGKIKFFIEGMNEFGQLISMEKEITLEDDLKE